ncbi:autophagy protein atg9 [Boothiomyces sp. JEL0838]|nr:autophagy protein atg9 [Boothiomyces sp. JEL0838]KAJ3313148.1 autophagy protein atg9 [Boothiomyces sp. JEL0838]
MDESEMELENFQKGLSQEESDSDLEPPFEIHGISPAQNQTFPHPLEPKLFDGDFAPFPQTVKTEQGNIPMHNTVNDFPDTDSDDQAPESIQFEMRPLVAEDRPPNRQYDLSHLQTRPEPLRNRQRQDPRPKITGWKDVRNLDSFLTRIYNYYEGKGFVCIILNQITDLLTVLFIVVLCTFLGECIDYSLIHDSKKLEQILVPECFNSMRIITKFILFFSMSWILYQFIRIIGEIPNLLEIREFMHNVLKVNDVELQTILWNEVTKRMIETRKLTTQSHPNERFDAHVIANRILRKENYMIALFNKDILDLSVPFLGSSPWMTWLMQDYLTYGLFSYVFDESGKIRKRFLKQRNRDAIITLVLSPFLFFFMVVRSFFRMAEEYRQNPSLLGARSYSTLSHWKMREFNEMPHLFNKRLLRSYENANKYMQQFPNQVVVILAKFIAFVSGSFATVLLVITLFEEEFQQGFEITPTKSAFFYIGVFGSIMAIAQGATQENIVHEPTRWFQEVVLDTHYNPPEWRDQSHTQKVRDEFGTMFQYKIVLIGLEILSVILAPAILYFSLPSCSGKIIDFFREFSVHVDSTGYVCSFAVFDFEKNGNAKYGATNRPINEDKASKNGKMEVSMINFKNNNPDWDPGNRNTEYISRLINRRPMRNDLARTVLTQRMTGMGMGMSHAMGNSEIPHSMMQGESMIGSVITPENIGRELFGLLDAMYEANRNLN